jgi:hypothetical protein
MSIDDSLCIGLERGAAAPAAFLLNLPGKSNAAIAPPLPEVDGPPRDA